MKHIKIYGLFIIWTIINFTVMSAQSIQDRVNSRNFPSVFQAWAYTTIDNLNEDRNTSLARHDLFWHAPAVFKLVNNNTYEGLSDGFTEESIRDAISFRNELLDKNPNQVLLAEIRYRDAHSSYLPNTEHPWWLRDNNGDLVFGWQEGGYIRLNLHNSDFQDLIAAQAGAAVKSGAVDGIMLDWWTENEYLESRLQILRKIRQAIGEDALIIVNSNDRLIPESAPYVNGMFMETGNSQSANQWNKYLNNLQWGDNNLREPQINCLETWYVSSRNDLNLMRATTTLTLTMSDGYALFSDPNPLTTPDHLHNWYDFWDAELGKPMGRGYKRADNAYERKFTEGIAIYNPPGNETISITFEQNVKSSATGRLQKTHTINSLDGDIFIGDTNTETFYEITSINAPTTVIPGESYTINIPYLSTGDADINISLQNKDENWITEGSAKVSVNGNGTATLEIMVDQDAKLGNNYIWQAYINPVGGDWTNRYDNKQINDIKCVERFNILNYTPPEIVIPGESYTINIPYLSTGDADINISLQNKDENWITEGSAKVSVNGNGTATLEVMVDQDAKLGNNYIWQAYITPVGGDWTNRYDNKQIDRISCVNNKNNTTEILETDNKNIKFYPNPVENVIILKSNNTLKEIRNVKIYDMGGRVIKELPEINLDDNKEKMINVSHFSDGMYILSINFLDGKTQNSQFIIKH